MSKIKAIAAAFLLLTVTTAALPLYASIASAQDTQTGQADPSEFPAIDSAKFSLSDAIASAEKQFGGKAASATIDDESKSLAYEIELLTASGEQKVSVDAASGKASVMASEAETGGDNGEANEGSNGTEQPDPAETGEDAN